MCPSWLHLLMLANKYELRSPRGQHRASSQRLSIIYNQLYLFAFLMRHTYAQGNFIVTHCSVNNTTILY